MGGRGSYSYSKHHSLDQARTSGYNVISFDDARGGTVYPFLEKCDRAWHLLTHSVDTAVDYLKPHTFNQSYPTLRWVNGENIVDLFVDGLDTEQFLSQTELALDMDKGGFVLSKRLSRVMRPYRVQQMFSAENAPTIAYMQQTPAEAKVWDGAGLISRRLLTQISRSTSLLPTTEAALQHELANAQRVEFTLLTANGQDKGHAIVADDLCDATGNPVDFLLPQDTKGEVNLTVDGAFVGINVVHGRDEMRLDIQSLINLYPYFDNAQLLSYLHDEGELFVESVESGDIAEVMGRIDNSTTGAELLRWPLKEYLAAGGHPLWFRAHVKGLINQHLKRLNHTQLEKLRLPIPGGRHYVMPAAVGQRADYPIVVGRGEVQIDPDSGTAWVNDNDWLALQDSPDESGIADILGGADNDDALWLHPFTDYDGKKQVLAWRSPNQLGEYVILQPTKNSAELPFPTANGGFISFPAADSRKLPKRIDSTETAYLGLIEPQQALGVQPPAYTVAAMENAIQQAVANQGALGMYCNSLMLSQALFGKLPDNPPAPLEEIIDSAVKTGADLSAIVQWNYDYTQALLEQGVPLPPLLGKRLSIDRSDPDNRPPSPHWSDDHWLAELQEGIQTHIAWVEEKRDELAGKARPPEVLFDTVVGDEEALTLGRGLNKVFSAQLNAKKKHLLSSNFDGARDSAENYLSHFHPALQQRILLEAISSVYAEDSSASDAVAWLANNADSQWFQDSSIARQMIEALRSIQLLNG